MRVAVASEPGSDDRDNEDWVSTTPHVVVVLDGATARTDTGCVHGVAWYATKLGAAIATRAAEHDVPLADALAEAITDVAKQHPECDLSHPGTPSAAAGIVRAGDERVEFLVLGDVTVVADINGELEVISDERVSTTATAERAEADRHPIGSPEKAAAMLAMKHIELASRNREDGYWVAETNPEAAKHAITGSFPRKAVRCLAVVTDGAARAVTFGLMTWDGLLLALQAQGPSDLIERVRMAEYADPNGLRWPRNKRSDDATVAYVRL